MTRRRPEAPRAPRGGIGFEFTLVLIAAVLAMMFGAFERGTFALLGVEVPALPLVLAALALPVVARFSAGRLDKDRLRLVGGLLAAAVAGVWLAVENAGRPPSAGLSILLAGLVTLGLAEAAAGWWGRHRSPESPAP